MSRKIILSLIISLLILIILILIALYREAFLNWIRAEWLKIIYAAILAIIVGLIIEYVYNKYSAKSKLLQTTVSPPNSPNRARANLKLKERVYHINEYEKTFGREDFIGVAITDDLLFIGKEHFKIRKEDDGYYIEDLNTKNGTLVGGEEINGKGEKKLEDGVIIKVAGILEISYHQE
jgi:pSer/pThr/pTyr-binding forkhead associated (FHA) protein